MTSGLPDSGWSGHPRTQATEALTVRDNQQVAKYSETPVLNESSEQAPQNMPPEVRIPDRVRTEFASITNLDKIWSLYHPGTR